MNGRPAETRSLLGIIDAAGEGMNSSYISVLVGGLIGSTSTVVGAVLSHRFTRNRDRRTAGLQGLRELAVVRMRMQRRDELEFEADLATIRYQWAVAGVSPNVTSAYLRAARCGAMASRAGRKLDDEYLQPFSQLDHLIEVELIRPSRGRRRIRREQIATDLTERICSIEGTLDRA